MSRLSDAVAEALTMHSQRPRHEVIEEESRMREDWIATKLFANGYFFTREILRAMIAAELRRRRP